MYHEDILVQAGDYHTGRLGKEGMAAVEAHLEGCPDCRDIYARWVVSEPSPALLASVMDGLPGKAAASPMDVFMARAGLWGAVAASILVGAAFWHPERDWLDADRGFALCERPSFVCPGGSTVPREARHE